MFIHCRHKSTVVKIITFVESKMIHISCVSFEAFMTVMFQFKVCWVVMPCGVVVGYQCFRGQCCLHLQGEVNKMGENGTDVGPDWRGMACASSQ